MNKTPTYNNTLGVLTSAQDAVYADDMYDRALWNELWEIIDTPLTTKVDLPEWSFGSEVSIWEIIFKEMEQVIDG
jgi:hypothetical protein